MGIQIRTAQRTKCKILPSVNECRSSLQAKIFKSNVHVCALSTLSRMNTGQSKLVSSICALSLKVPGTHGCPTLLATNYAFLNEIFDNMSFSLLHKIL